MAVSERYRGNRTIEKRWEYAVEVMHQRRLYDNIAKRQMIDAAERYNHTIVFPLPEVEGEPEFPPIAAAIIADSIDSFGVKANDTTPVITAPAIDPSALSHRKRADQRKNAWGATYHESQLDLKTARCFRQIFGYGTFCMVADPMFHDQYGRPVNRARLETRDPLLTYPEPMANDEIRAPADIGFIYGRSPQTLMAMYPEAASLIRSETTADDDLWDVLDWTDSEWRFVGILGKRASQSYNRRYDAAGTYSVYGDRPIDRTFLVRAYPNRADMVTAVCPQAVTLDRLVSAITRIVPITDVMNKLAAINFIAGEKSVFPHIVVLGEQGETPTLTDGVFHDGREGKANLIEGARSVATLSLQPAQQAQVLLSDLERNARMSSGNPSLFQGEASGSIRSGQTVSQLAGYSIDPRIGEAHKIMGYALRLMNESIAAIEEGYWPRRKYTVFSGWNAVNRQITYTPKIWEETKESTVSYPMPGMDAQNATVAIGQLNQARMMSRKTGMKKHPLIQDEVGEEQLLMEESLDDAIMMTVVQLVSSGQMAITDLGRMRELVREGMMPEKALAKVQEEAQDRQATAAPAPETPDQVLPPGAMPGINGPEAGGQMALPPGPAPPGPGAGSPEAFEQIAQALMAGGGPA